MSKEKNEDTLLGHNLQSVRPNINHGGEGRMLGEVRGSFERSLCHETTRGGPYDGGVSVREKGGGGGEVNLQDETCHGRVRQIQEAVPQQYRQKSDGCDRSASTSRRRNHTPVPRCCGVVRAVGPTNLLCFRNALVI